MITTKTGVSRHSEKANCPIFIPHLLKDDLISQVLIHHKAKVIKNDPLNSDDHVLKLFFYRFFSNLKPANNGYCDTCINELMRLHFCDHKVFNGSLVIKAIKSIDQFNGVVQNLIKTNPLTSPYLNRQNIALRPKNKKYGIRKKTVSSGKAGAHEFSFFYTPAHEIPKLFNNLLRYINKEKISIHEALLYQLQFILIHPFNDANGRTSRALFLSLLYQNYGLIYPSLLILFMHLINRRNHYKNIKAYRDGDLKTWGKYCDEMILWANHSHQLLNEILRPYHKNTHRKNDKNRQLNKHSIINGLNEFDYYLKFELHKYSFKRLKSL